MNFQNYVQLILEKRINELSLSLKPSFFRRLFFKAKDRQLLVKEFEEANWEKGYFLGEPKCQWIMNTGSFKSEITEERYPISDRTIVFSYCIDQHSRRILSAELFHPRMGITYIIYVSETRRGFETTQERIWIS